MHRQRTLGAPGKVARLEAEGAELQVPAAAPHRAHALLGAHHQLGVGGGAACGFVWVACGCMGGELNFWQEARTITPAQSGLVEHHSLLLTQPAIVIAHRVRTELELPLLAVSRALATRVAALVAGVAGDTCGGGVWGWVGSIRSFDQLID